MKALSLLFLLGVFSGAESTTGTIIIDEQYNDGANVAAYSGQDATDPYDGAATTGNASFQVTKAVGSNINGLFRPAFYFQLPDGYTSAQITNAVLRFSLNSTIDPVGDLNIYAANTTSVGSRSASFAKAMYSDSSFSDTGLGLTPAASVGMKEFDVTALVQSVADQGASTNVIAFRLQMEGDTAVTYQADARYVILGFGIGNAASRPELVLETTSGTIIIDEQYNGGANVAAYSGQDATDPYDGAATTGNASFQVTKAVGSNVNGLFRPAFYFQLPDGYTSAQITNAVLRFSLNTKIDPVGDLNIYAANITSLGSKDISFAEAMYSDSSFSDTGLGLTPSASTGRKEFDVTALVQAAADQQSSTKGIAFRLQMEGDTAVPYQSDSRYVVVGFGVGDAASRPELVLGADPLPGVGIANTGQYAGQMVCYNQTGDITPLRAFGVNYYDAFLRYLVNSNDTTFIEGFSYLHDHNIPVARVIAGGYWPNDWSLYFSDKTEYYNRLDYFIRQAESNEIGLIIVPFWAATVPGELVDDAVAAGYITPNVDFTPNNPLNTNIYDNPTYAEYKCDLGRTNSGTTALIAYYTSELVSRYADSSAVWGWEFCNELNSLVDHPNVIAMRKCRYAGAGMTLPQTSTNLVELPAWTGPDDLIRAEAGTAKLSFAQTIRSTDPWRIITSGDALPRTSAYHNYSEHSWTLDSRSELALVLPLDNPEPIDTVTVHFYPGPSTGTPVTWFTDNPVTNRWLTGQYEELLDYFMYQSADIGRPLVVGEFGAGGDGTTIDEKTTFHRLVQALIDTEVQLSLLWTFDTRNVGMIDTWWIQTGMVSGYPASEKLYQITNDDSDLWDLEQANLEYGAW